MNNYQVTYSVGSLGYVRLTVYTDVDKNDKQFMSIIDELCVDAIVKEVTDYGDIKSID